MKKKKRLPTLLSLAFLVLFGCFFAYRYYTVNQARGYTVKTVPIHLKQQIKTPNVTFSINEASLKTKNSKIPDRTAIALEMNLKQNEKITDKTAEFFFNFFIVAKYSSTNQTSGLVTPGGQTISQLKPDSDLTGTVTFTLQNDSIKNAEKITIVYLDRIGKKQRVKYSLDITKIAKQSNTSSLS